MIKYISILFLIASSHFLLAQTYSVDNPEYKNRFSKSLIKDPSHFCFDIQGASGLIFNNSFDYKGYIISPKLNFSQLFNRKNYGYEIGLQYDFRSIKGKKYHFINPSIGFKYFFVDNKSERINKPDYCRNWWSFALQGGLMPSFNIGKQQYRTSSFELAPYLGVELELNKFVINTRLTYGLGNRPKDSDNPPSLMTLSFGVGYRFHSKEKYNPWVKKDNKGDVYVWNKNFKLSETGVERIKLIKGFNADLDKIKDAINAIKSKQLRDLVSGLPDKINEDDNLDEFIGKLDSIIREIKTLPQKDLELSYKLELIKIRLAILQGLNN